MAGQILDLSVRAYVGLVLPRQTDTDTDTPGGLTPDGNVPLDDGLREDIQSLMGLLRLGAWTIVLLCFIGVGVSMAWGWMNGKGFQALGRLGWVLGGAIVIASGAELLNVFTA
ncbi:hypothetical protein [Yinghuangia sp. YIM S09857]|uniref:hypothetical protein n=1 Tax=Yinghuangia sp. YIM S09857 TaxID=3436929 RepID=UPI003F53B93C